MQCHWDLYIWGEHVTNLKTIKSFWEKYHYTSVWGDVNLKMYNKDQ